MDLQSFVGAVLTRCGGVVEPKADDRILALLPAPVAASLGVGEEVGFCLRGAASPGEIHAGFGAATLARICALADTLQRCYRVEIGAPPPKKERVEREAEAALAIRDGTAKIDDIEASVLDYIVADFRYVALSEDRHEGLVSVALDLGSGCSSPGLARGLDAYLFAHPETRRTWTGAAGHEGVGEPIERVSRLALACARAETAPFVARMARRLQRDAARIDDYYRTLRDEVERRRGRAADVDAKLDAKVAAIEAEKLRRRGDLERRYAVRLRLEPLAVLHVRASGLAVRIRLRRRGATSEVRLGWNAVARELDRWTCDACGREEQAPALCDALHRLCAGCAPRCTVCESTRATGSGYGRTAIRAERSPR